MRKSKLAGKDKRSTGDKIDVYFDGQCPMCNAVVARLDQSRLSECFLLHDMHQTGSLPFPREAVEKEIHVVAPDGKIRTGADAIIYLAERFPKLGPITRSARAAPIWVFAPLVYWFVAANRRFLFGPAARIYWLKVAVVVTLSIEFAMSPRLWIGPRTFPLVPAVDWLPQLPVIVAIAMYALFFVASAGALLSAKPQRFLASSLCILVVFCLFDQTRWQPWVFMLAAMLVPLSFFSWLPGDKNGLNRALNITRLIIVATYFYSGLQKVNLNFMTNEFPWIVQPITDVFPFARDALQTAGFAAPFVQMFFGLGLLLPRLRRPALFLAVSMHVFILCMFGPLGQNWNDIIWPWTASMAVFDVLLFAGLAQFEPRAILCPGQSRLHWGALILFGILPAFSFFNLWDSYLSAALYSGNLTDGVIYASDAGKSAMPPKISRWLVHSSTNTNVLNLQRWAIEELNVSTYSETRVFMEIARKVCAEMRDPSQLVLVDREQRAFFSRAETYYRCADLMRPHA